MDPLQDILPDFPSEFELLGQIGAGGQAIVYRARHRHLDKLCAIKILRSDPGSESGLLDEFQREAKALSKLQHPNIVNLLQVGVAPGDSPYLVYELIEGRTLRELMDSNEEINKDTLASIFTQIISALDYAHSKGVIHGDITPSNIMLLADPQTTYQVKLVDFGLAKARILPIRTDDSSHPKLALTLTATTSGAIAGSPLYMSPEQCKGEPIDARSDLYSLACVLYECLFAAPPFNGETSLELMYKHVHEAPQLSSPKLSNAGKSFFASALSKDLSSRPQSALQFAEGIKNVLRGDKAPAAMSVPLFATVILVLCGLIAFLFFATTRKTAHLAPIDSSPVHPSSVEQDPYDPYPSLSENTSPERKLTLICERVFSRTYASPKKTNAGKLLVELDRLIPKLKNKQEYLFPAYVCKGRLLVILERPALARSAFQEAVIAGRIDGKDTHQNILAYGELMQCEIALDHLKDAEAHLNKMRKLLKLAESEDLPNFELPKLLQPIFSKYPESLVLETQASISLKRMDLKDARDCYQQASDLSFRVGLTYEGALNIISLANTYMTQNDRKQALLLIDGLIEKLKSLPDAQNTSWSNTGGQSMAFCAIAEWLLDAREVEKAEIAKDLAEKKLLKFGRDRGYKHILFLKVEELKRRIARTRNPELVSKEQAHEKTTIASTVSSEKKLENRLSEIREIVFKKEYEDRILEAELRPLLAELDSLSREAKKRHDLLYSIWQLRARIYLRLNELEEARKAFLHSLTRSKTPDGKETLESISPYVSLMDLDFRLKRYLQCEDWAKKIEALIEREQTEEVPEFRMPASLRVALSAPPGIRSQSMLGQLALIRGNYDAALSYLTQAKELCMAASNPNEEAKVTQAIAFVYEKKGKAASGRKLVDELRKRVTESDPRTTSKINNKFAALFSIAEWYYQQGDNKAAEDCRKEVLETYANLKSDSPEKFVATRHLAELSKVREKALARK